MAPRSSLRIIVTGLVGAYPVGGVAWDYLQYPVGLARLGHDVVYHEDTWIWPYHPIENQPVETASYSVDYIARFFRNYAPELSSRWHYRHLNREFFGISEADFTSFARSADLCLNVSAANPLPQTLGSRCVKVFLDTDPGYNQIVLSQRPQWSANVERWIEDFGRHDRYLTYAENIGEADCLVPRLNVDWITTRMPIVLAFWDNLPAPPRGAPWSTVMTWNDFPRASNLWRPRIWQQGCRILQDHLVAQEDIAPVEDRTWRSPHPRRSCSRQGWNAVDAPKATLTPESYCSFIADLRGEVSTAKNVYVGMRTGWFSCRTARYLAAGRPAVVQDTGFTKHISVGEGFLPSIQWNRLVLPWKQSKAITIDTSQRRATSPENISIRPKYCRKCSVRSLEPDE